MANHRARSQPGQSGLVEARARTLSGPAILEFAAIPEPSVSLMHALARLVIAVDEGDRRAVEYLREELALDFGWVVRPPALPPDWRRP